MQINAVKQDKASLYPFGYNFAIHALFYTRWGIIAAYSRHILTRISSVIASLGVKLGCGGNLQVG